MHPLLSPLRFLYARSRRLGVIDVTCLFRMQAGTPDGHRLPDGYTIHRVSAEQLSSLRRRRLVHAQVGSETALERDDRALIGVFAGARMVSFAWLATTHLASWENYSRAIHLGTSIDLPAEAAFVYNAWTDPDHRGRRLLAAALDWCLRHGGVPSSCLATMIDWTNRTSIRAFQRCGMRRLGVVIRLGKGRYQFSVTPALARQLGFAVAAQAPGWRWAYGRRRSAAGQGCELPAGPAARQLSESGG